MTKREITRRALRHQETGHMPSYLSLLPPARGKLIEHYGREDLTAQELNQRPRKHDATTL